MIRKITLLSCLAVFSSLTGCAFSAGGDVTAAHFDGQLPTAYDYQLLNHRGRAQTLLQMVSELEKEDVVFIGEYHGNQASHLLEMQVLAALHRRNLAANRQTVLSLEMFNRDQQAILNDYIAGTIGEKYLIDEAPAWKNYQGSYRPLVEYAKQNGIPVIAANAAGDIVRCIGRQAEGYVEKLDQTEKMYIARQPFAEIPGYSEKFYGLMGGTAENPSQHQRQAYLGQITRDNTMAESIAEALMQSPGAQVVHINGSFHSEDHLGTVAALKRLGPGLNVSVITPIHLDEFSALQGESLLSERDDDFYYLLNSQPKEFVNSDYMKKVRKEMFDKAREKGESCK
ncbi:ChaN family lipoprotein [Microbulbifer sp.]|uniref:ChaN family lipoprotein n=1 Tax=Microbulbifer sp. TaxID=1908541 RepID=UPI002F94EDAA